MVGLRLLKSHKRVWTWALLIAFTVYLGAPGVALSRPPSMANGVEGESYSSGEPVGGERKDVKPPSNGSIYQDANGEGGQFGCVPVPGGAGQDDLRVQVIILPLVGILGGVTFTVFLPSVWKVPSGVR
jgi:hypothetical protein